MPYRSDAQRCDAHISFFKRELAKAKRAARLIPSLESKIAEWERRKKELTITTKGK